MNFWFFLTVSLNSFGNSLDDHAQMVRSRCDQYAQNEINNVVDGRRFNSSEEANDFYNQTFQQLSDSCFIRVSSAKSTDNKFSDNPLKGPCEDSRGTWVSSNETCTCTGNFVNDPENSLICKAKDAVAVRTPVPPTEGEPEAAPTVTPTPPAEGAPTPPPGTPGGTQPVEYEYTTRQARDLMKLHRDECQQAFSEANECCNDPMQCLFGVSFGSQSEMNILLNTMVGIGGQVLSAKAGGDDKQGINKACSIMKTAGFTIAGLNASAAVQCKAYQSTCSSVCEERVEIISNVAQLCGLNPETGVKDETNNRCEPGAIQELQVAYTALNGKGRSCDQFNSNIVEAGLAGIQSAQAAKLSELCQKASKGPDPADTGLEKPKTPIVGTSDCSNPANFNDPACSCSNPNFENLPRCRGQAPGQGLQGPGSTSIASGGTGFGGRGGSNTGELPVAANQLPQTERIAPEEASSTGIQPGQGGGPPLGGPPGPAAAGGGGGQQGQAPGYNTDVLSRNAVGGGGYSVSPGPAFASGGGFSGYGTAGAARDPASKKPGLNLKDFLPGGQKDPTRRMAGVGGTLVPEEERRGASHQNIFEMVSERIRLYCQLKGLLEDCPKKRTLK